MKLVAVLLLSLAALAWADTSYQNFQTYADQHEDAASQYQPLKSKKQGIAKILDRVQTIRRQGIANFVPSNFIVFIVIAGLIAAGVAVVSLWAATYNNSGRGLDVDEWEVDHSVWMNQLQKDFEDSWSQE